MELSEESAVNQEKKERESERMVGEKKKLCLLTTSPFFLGFSLSFSPLFFLCVHCKASLVNEYVCVCT